jgi:hypothetical protein
MTSKPLQYIAPFTGKFPPFPLRSFFICGTTCQHPRKAWVHLPHQPSDDGNCPGCSCLCRGRGRGYNLCSSSSALLLDNLTTTSPPPQRAPFSCVSCTILSSILHCLEELRVSVPYLHTSCQTASELVWTASKSPPSIPRYSAAARH